MQIEGAPTLDKELEGSDVHTSLMLVARNPLLNDRVETTVMFIRRSDEATGR